MGVRVKVGGRRVRVRVRARRVRVRPSVARLCAAAERR